MTAMPPRFLVESIVEDVIFFLRLLKALIAHRDSALLSPAIMPAASLFVVESYARLSDYSLISKDSLSEESLDLIRPARHRTKLLLSSTKDINTIVADFDQIVEDERDAFIGLHTGWLAPLKKFIQPDLGLSTYDGHVVTTTHGTRFLFGADSHEPQRLREAARVVSAYCNQLAGAFARFAGIHADVKPFPPQDDIEIVMKDIKCESLYRRGTFGALPLEWSGTIAMILANLNFVHHVLRRLVPKNLRTFLKIRLLYAFHAIHSLRLIQDRFMAERRLPPSVAAVLARALGTSEVRWLKKRGDLRDTLMHFQPARVTPTLSAMSFDEVLSQLCGKREGTDLDTIADNILEHFSATLAAGFDLSAKTFWYATVK